MIDLAKSNRFVPWFCELADEYLYLAIGFEKTFWFCKIDHGLNYNASLLTDNNIEKIIHMQIKFNFKIAIVSPICNFVSNLEKYYFVLSINAIQCRTNLRNLR